MQTTVYRLNDYQRAEDIFELFHQEKNAVFLDSSLNDSLGQYSIIGLDPYLILQETDGKLFKNGFTAEGSIEDALQEQLSLFQEENPTALPLIAGAIGYFSYDYGRKFEHIQTRHEKRLEIPDALFLFYDILIIDDKVNKALYLTVRGEKNDPSHTLEKFTEMFKGLPAYPIPEKQSAEASFIPNFTKDDYKKTIDQMISYIIEGDIYIANMTQQLQIPGTKAPYDTYRYLRTYNPSPFGSYMNFGDFQIVSASPERFLQIKDHMIETRPIKGTRRRGYTPEEDDMLREELRNSSKDKSELLMIVDLERNDLNHICIPGSVRVTEHFAVEEYATVFHLVTTVVGEVRSETTVPQLLHAAFPGGSITGAPKIRAMQIIDELEHDRRNLYTGSIGYFSLDGNCDLNIVIRTAIHKDGVYHLGVGGGITCESDLEFEYEETLQKARAVLTAINDSI